MDRSIADRSTYGLAAGALMVIALAGFADIGEETETALAVAAAEVREPEEFPTLDPEYPDARALVLAIAALLEAQ